MEISITILIELSCD